MISRLICGALELIGMAMIGVVVLIFLIGCVILIGHAIP